MKKRKWIYPLLVLIVAAGIIGYNYIYQDHRDIKKEKAAFTVKATDLTAAFQNDETAATEKYLNQTIEVQGQLTGIDGTSLVLENVVFFALSENETVPNQTKLNTNVTLKGRCIGYDSLLEEVKLDQASLIE